MNSRIEEAAQKKLGGYNCAQAVACTYCDLAGIDEETMAALNQGFGGGIGGSMAGTCGAITGAVNVLGAIYKDPMKTRAAAKRIITAFEAQNGATICADIKGIKDGVVKRSCTDCVKDAAKFLEEELNLMH